MAHWRIFDEQSSFGQRLIALLVLPFALIWVCICFATNFPFWLLRLVLQQQDQLPFDEAQWKNAHPPSKESPIRVRMVKDLLRQHILEGKTRLQIMALLGNPDHELVYSLGYGPEVVSVLQTPLCYLPFPISLIPLFANELAFPVSWWLVIDLAEDGVCKDAHITRSTTG